MIMKNFKSSAVVATLPNSNVRYADLNGPVVVLRQVPVDTYDYEEVGVMWEVSARGFTFEAFDDELS
jgi:hypothetical protein